ncbi:MAG: hypothetical protein M3P39_03090 [Actinomycetota bacterium]|jgi:hypothetical protein|nr:hypothetical protein [Actinomycetota bacterium]
MIKLSLPRPLRAPDRTSDAARPAPAQDHDGLRTRSALAVVGLWPPPGEQGGR